MAPPADQDFEVPCCLKPAGYGVANRMKNRSVADRTQTLGTLARVLQDHGLRLVEFGFSTASVNKSWRR